MKKIFFAAGLLIVLFAPFFGQMELSLAKLLDPSAVDYKLFWDLRLPRVVTAFFCGSLLGVSGLLFQSLFRNPMSTPYTLGVASGATIGSAFAIVFGFVGFVAIFGFLGALFTIFVLFGLASRLKSYERSSLLLVGIALSFFYSASLMILFYLSNESQSYEIVRFTMGSLDVVGFSQVLPIAAASLALFLVALKYKKELLFLLTSHENAFLKGIEVHRVNTVLLGSVSVAIGVAVSITGPIGFVGLIVPHIIKNICKKSSDKLLGVTFFYSGIFLVLCDLIARNLGTSSSVPIGVVTSFLGAPFFIYLIIKRQK